VTRPIEADMACPRKTSRPPDSAACCFCRTFQISRPS
jgi:hypothetical protein